MMALATIPPKEEIGSVSAVIFGYSWKFPLRWRLYGDPEEGEPELPAEKFEALFHGSGIELISTPSVPGSSASPFPSPG